jgi:hypothetical protein
VKEKVEQDFAFLDEYSSPTRESLEKSEEVTKSKEEHSDSPETKSSQDQSDDDAQAEVFQGLD